MRYLRKTARIVVLGCWLLGNSPLYAQIQVTINTREGLSPISPYIYGSNQTLSNEDVWTVRRLGGNRLTGYNWENNNSNAGADYQHSSDGFLISNANIPGSQSNQPGIVMTHFHDQSLAMGAQSILTLQMAGYVSKDRDGTVDASDTAPSERWVKVEAKKGSPFSTSPNLSDDRVYMDEFVHFMMDRYGEATAPDGVRWYSLDNEPALWAHTHPRIHPEQVGAKEVVDRSVALASAVKAIDPQAAILGPALFGMSGYENLLDAPDWDQVGTGYAWFVDYYLDQMQQAEQDHGQRLLDVLDVHWYPEARGDHRITDGSAVTQKDVAARLQAPRTLWDPSYVEDSWIGQWKTAFLPLIPKLQDAIATHYPGTRLAITEYNYGAANSISGGLAQADVLGILGKYEVYLATLWKLEDRTDYLTAAFNLYRNYDGARSTYGNTNVLATTSDIMSTSVYAAIQDDDPSELHIIFINKDLNEAHDLQFAIESDVTYAAAEVWAFDQTSPIIRQIGQVDPVSDNTFLYHIPEATAAHVILRGMPTATESVPEKLGLSLSTFPNPSRSTVTFAYEVAPGKSARLHIYDLLGQVVKSFTSLQGSHRITWNGRDDQGRALAAGVYLARLQTGAQNLTRRFVLVP